MHNECKSMLPSREERQVGHRIISFLPDEMIGQAYYRPATATDTGLGSFLLTVTFNICKERISKYLKGNAAKVNGLS